MTNKLIITDVDGVLLNWMEPFIAWMKSKGHVLPARADDSSYSLGKLFNLPDWVIDHLIREFNESSNVAFMPAYGEAGHYVKRLADKGFRFATCTSFGGTPSSRALRVFNLENLFGKVFEEHNIIELHGDKSPVLSKWKGSECWWIEDNLNNARKGMELGLRPILVRHPHNADYEGDDMLVAHNWREIYTIITGEQEYDE